MPKLSSVLAALGISAFAWTGVAAQQQQHTCKPQTIALAAAG